MQAMRLLDRGASLTPLEVTLPPPAPGELLIRVEACGVCRTDLHLIDGELPDIHYPVTPGHEIVGVVTQGGADETRFSVGDRVGVPWLAWTCGVCPYCRAGLENLCVRARFTGYTRDGGYAQEVLADARYCLRLPANVPAARLAPLLCAGLIGYRAYRKTGDAASLGLYGFGAAAHLLVQIAIHEGRRVFAFTREGDLEGQVFARSLGAVWAGSSAERPPQELDAAILFAPVGALIPAALAAVRPGGRVICAGIHMSDVPSFPYRLLWGERSVASVANLTRTDGEEFVRLATRLGLTATVERFALEDANRALERLRSGAVKGAAVLEMP
jgi:propanol-preferring alcohol dehydrogenase